MDGRGRDIFKTKTKPTVLLARFVAWFACSPGEQWRGRVRGSPVPGVFFPLGGTEMALLDARAAGISPIIPPPLSAFWKPIASGASSAFGFLPSFALLSARTLRRPLGLPHPPLEVAQSTSFSLSLAASSAAPKYRVQASPAPVSSVEVDYKARSGAAQQARPMRIDRGCRGGFKRRGGGGVCVCGGRTRRQGERGCWCRKQAQHNEGVRAKPPEQRLRCLSGPPPPPPPSLLFLLLLVGLQSPSPGGAWRETDVRLAKPALLWIYPRGLLSLEENGQ